MRFPMSLRSKIFSKRLLLSRLMLEFLLLNNKALKKKLEKAGGRER
jgi:hypothetical protein